jgi:hypothetical protein
MFLAPNFGGMHTARKTASPRLESHYFHFMNVYYNSRNGNGRLYAPNQAGMRGRPRLY